MINADTNWIKQESFTFRPTLFAGKALPSFIPSVSPEAFTDAKQSRKIPYASTGNAHMTDHSSANSLGFTN
jgi:hypothetical protein